MSVRGERQRAGGRGICYRADEMKRLVRGGFAMGTLSRSLFTHLITRYPLV